MLCSLCHHDHPEGAACPEPLPMHGGVSAAGYRLVRELGRGLAGVVYLAEHGATGMPVAVKLLPPELVGDKAQARRFAIEARCTNRVIHDAIVNVFDFNDEDADGPWLVMEYLEGLTLSDVTARGIELGEAVALLEQLGAALDAAHAVGIVHGGLVPGKVMVVAGAAGRGPQVKVLPFGVDTGEVDSEDVPFAKLGDPAWRPPEQTRGEPPHRHGDIYAFGCLGYLLATGRPPFTTLSLDALVRAHAEVTPDAPHRVKPGVPRAFSAALLRALEKDPGHRYASASQLVEALRSALLRPAEPIAAEPLHGSPGAVVGGLADGFVVRDSPVPAPAPGGARPGGLADGFLVRESPVPAPPGAPGSSVAVARPAASSSPSPAPARTVSPTPMASPVPMSSSLSPVPGAASPAGLVLRVSVRTGKGELLGQFACASVTRQGGVVCSDTVRPPLLDMVKLTFDDLDGLACDARVVQHISVEQAAQWKMSAGFSVQFEGLSADQRAQIEAGHTGVLGPESPSQVARRPDDPNAADVLRRFSPEASKDVYAMLGLSKASPFDAIRDRLRDARRALDGLKQRPLSVLQLEALEAARGRLELMGGRVSEPLERLEYDAERGNFEGVARCIGAGVPITEVEAARARFLESRADLDEKSRARLAEGQALEAAGQRRKALEVYTAALVADPLHVTLQQRFWSVRRQLE